jgi:hypothetical protein
MDRFAGSSPATSRARIVIVRMYLVHNGDSVELPPGEIVIGRDAPCHLRFNDPSVSRRHLRIVRRRDESFVEDLGSTNGTLLNGRVASGPTPIRDGDIIAVGTRELRIRVGDDEFNASPTVSLSQLSSLASRDASRFATAPIRALSSSPTAPAPNRAPTVSTNGPAPTRPPIVSTTAPAPNRPLNVTPTVPIRAITVPAATPQPSHQRCPRCGMPVSSEEDSCGSCHYEWGTFRTSSPTLSTANVLARRGAARLAVELHVLYVSTELEVETTTRDLSLSGVLVCSQVLDPVGTKCDLTILADAMPPLQVGGVVRRVVAHERPGGAPVGMGVEFARVGTPERAWLETVISRVSAAG